MRLDDFDLDLKVNREKYSSDDNEPNGVSSAVTSIIATSYLQGCTPDSTKPCTNNCTEKCYSPHTYTCTAYC